MEHTISLNRNEQFLRIYRKGKRTYHRFFVLYYLPNGSRRNRLGLKVGKKLAKAVRRNRIRRLLKESYRLAEPQVRTGYDLIFVAREEQPGGRFVPGSRRGSEQTAAAGRAFGAGSGRGPGLPKRKQRNRHETPVNWNDTLLQKIYLAV